MRNTYAATLLLLLLIVSFPITVFAYYAGETSVFDSYEAFASFLFWFSVVSLAFLFPLRNITKLFLRYLRSAKGALIFVSYLSVHLILYGLILEGIIIYLYKVPEIISQGSVTFTSLLAYPESVISILENFAYYPSIGIAIPPAYDLIISLYSIGVAVVIAVLVVANIMKVGEISKVCTLGQKSRAIVVLPALGVIGGAACCLSIPFLISLVAPATALVSNSIDAYYVAYLGFPVATAIALKYNMDATLRIASKIGAP